MHDFAFADDVDRRGTSTSTEDDRYYPAISHSPSTPRDPVWLNLGISSPEYVGNTAAPVSYRPLSLLLWRRREECCWGPGRYFNAVCCSSGSGDLYSLPESHSKHDLCNIRCVAASRPWSWHQCNPIILDDHGRASTR